MLTARIWVCYVNNVLCAYFTWSQLDMLANARNAINRTCWLHDLPCTPHECANCLLTHSPIIVLAKRPPNRIIIMMKKKGNNIYARQSIHFQSAYQRRRATSDILQCVIENKIQISMSAPRLVDILHSELWHCTT